MSNGVILEESTYTEVQKYSGGCKTPGSCKVKLRSEAWSIIHSQTLCKKIWWGTPTEENINVLILKKFFLNYPWDLYDKKACFQKIIHYDTLCLYILLDITMEIIFRTKCSGSNVIGYYIVFESVHLDKINLSTPYPSTLNILSLTLKSIINAYPH